MKRILLLILLISTFAFGQRSRSYILSGQESGVDLTGLLSYHEFNSDLTDSYSTWNGTPLNAPSYTTGKIDNALITVAGVSYEGATIPDHAALTFSTFTASLWINDNSTGDQRGFLLNKRDVGLIEWQFVYYDTGYFVELYSANSTSILYRAQTTTTLSTNTWYHIAFTWDGTDETGIKVYVNGSPESSVNSEVGGTFTAMSNTSAPLHLGIPGFGLTNTVGWDGLIDELHLWSRVLSPDEIATVYALENVGTKIID